MSSRFLQKLAEQLFSDHTQREAFAQALAAAIPPAQALIWLKERPEILPFAVEGPSAFQPAFVDRVAKDARPGADPLHDDGYYYIFDNSSLFCASVLLEVPKVPEHCVLDVCASPGGKGIFAWRALHPELMLANEVNGKRLGALISNYNRCQISPARIIRNDSSILAQTLQDAITLVIVDAPCSGQSLLAKGKPVPGCFHPATMNTNANRQKRIIANAAKCVSPGGYLAYMTCTYSIEENEKVLAWLLKRFPEFTPVEIPTLAAHRSMLADFPAYRLWPFEELGAGGFTALLRRDCEGISSVPLLDDLHMVRTLGL